MSLEKMVAEAKARMEAMSPEERAEMFRLQRESWVRGELKMGETSAILTNIPLDKVLKQERHTMMLRIALEEIATSDNVDNALDPGRNKRVAMEALKGTLTPRPVPTIEQVELYRRARSHQWNAVYQALRDLRLSVLMEEDGVHYPLVDLLTREGVSITDGEMQLVDIVDEVFIALEAANTGSVNKEPDS